jgi:hypothetical protein
VVGLRLSRGCHIQTPLRWPNVVSRHNTVRLISAILAGVLVADTAGLRANTMIRRLLDDRIDGETRERHHQRYTAASISARGGG